MSTIVNMLNREACNHGLPKDDFQEKLRGPSYGTTVGFWGVNLEGLGHNR